MPGKLNIAFLWHMHQPYYRDPGSGKYILPWVRLHGIKGYLDMLEAVQRYGDVRVTFNLVPCLLRQLLDIGVREENDLYLDLALKPADSLEQHEKRILLKHFFSANPDNMVLRYPRYRNLLYRRSVNAAESDLENACRKFTVQDFRDLQVWFNLTWFGWAAEQKYPLISELKRKDRDFSEDEKLQLLALQRSILSQIPEMYASLWQQNRIEVSTTPFYHPILPLIVDNRAAKISQPDDAMPKHRFQRVEDAKVQLERGRDFIQQHLGVNPVGLWPSEGSVSPAVCELAAEVGFQWLATDENVLKATLQTSRRSSIYQTYLAFKDGPTLIFRDQYLSDAIGFRYARNTPKQSVDDFLGYLENCASTLTQPAKSVVAVILDGENAWEYFSDGGKGFFDELYSRISVHPRLRTTTIGDYITQYPAKTVLKPIFPASWINGSFRIWIGDPVKNEAWDRMAEAAQTLEQSECHASSREKAREWLLIAEGSDWFWWYGEPNHSEFEDEFDQLFRANLMQVYRELGLEIPSSLLLPIQWQRNRMADSPLFPMNPQIDGLQTTYYEWIGARAIHASDYSGAMNFGSGLV
ncbi:MAG: glycoside hydrolase family 57 protein, partial [bacterium]